MLLMVGLRAFGVMAPIFGWPRIPYDNYDVDSMSAIVNRQPKAFVLRRPPADDVLLTSERKFYKGMHYVRSPNCRQTFMQFIYNFIQGEYKGSIYTILHKNLATFI